MDILTIIFTVLGWGSLLFSLYGIINMNRSNFLIGTFIFSLLPVIGEFNVYNQSGNWGNIATITAFIGISIVVFPSKINYGSDNIAAVHLARKIGIAILVVNLLQALIILNLRNDVPFQFALMHLVESILMIIMLSKVSIKKVFNL